MLKAGWSIADKQEAAALLRNPDMTPVGLADRFRFRCVKSGECCYHEATSLCRHVHNVDGIDWRLFHGIWKCPFLGVDLKCNIYEERPISCRLFPLGLNIYPDVKKIVLWKFTRPVRCVSCYGGTKHVVSDWVRENGFWEHIEKVCK